MTAALPIKDFLAAAGVENWRVISDGATAFFPTKSLAAAARLVDAISEIDGIENHRPWIDIRNMGVTVRFLTRSAEGYGLSNDDLDFARKVDSVARTQGLQSDPNSIQSLLIIPGAPDRAAVMPFWKAVLGYEPRIDSPEEDLVDPHDRDAAFWFEQMDEPRPGEGGSIHVAVWVPIDKAEARVAAALAAGGRMVRDENSPSWWTLADAYGNEVDIATVGGRG
jgi:4a-hydroxytetrahydrobiopterin dehydratase